MTPEFVPPVFERLMGCTESDLLRALPAALPEAGIENGHQGGGIVATFDDGSLRLEWQKAPELQIGLLRLPRLQVRFEYRDLTAGRRHQIQRRFDLATQRGGG